MERDFDRSYADGFAEYRKMDLFLPEGERQQTALLFIHGGGWYKGRKEQWHSVCEHFADRGFVCASISYRLTPQFRFPAQVEDVRLAMQYLKGQSDDLGFARDRIVVVGSSAGGYLACMLATLGRDDSIGATKELRDRDTMPYAVIGYCPITTLFVSKTTIEQLMVCSPDDNEQLYRDASPVCRVSGREPPFLLLHGDMDMRIPVEEVKSFHERLLAEGGSSRLVILPGVPHGFGYGVRTPAQLEALAQAELFLRQL